MTIREILRTVEEGIRDPKEREYFMIHEARYRYILEQISKLVSGIRYQVSGKTNVVTHDTLIHDTKFKILDVGCFPYHLGKALEIMGHEVWGISSAHEPVKQKNIRTCNIESDRFPFNDNYFDLVVCTEVLEHLPQSPVHALHEMRRVMKPGGKLLITTPNIARSINRAKLLLGKSVTYPLHQLLENDGAGSNLYHRHNREYTLKELSTIIIHAHFSVDTATQFVSYTPGRRRVIPDPLWLKAGKTVNYVLMMMVTGLRDTLLVVGKK
jgi:2-polyprenyl-3-methyl-5-hydroxy-6-metoxy-1,4-benzoquinol methylase